MNSEETRAIITISLLAAYADGDKHDREREEIRRIAEGLAGDQGVNLPGLYQDVLMKRVSVSQAAQALSSAESRQLAYEMAVCVCDVDGVHSQREKAFLDSLRSELKLENATAEKIVQSADAISEAPLDVGSAELPATTTPANNEELDRMILNAAILNGALELLPETLSTMAIVPLQMKLVYRIGKTHGYELDRGHVKDFLATAGVGLTSQYLEQAGRKLLGGLLGKVGGGLLRGMGNQAVSSGMSFASTYALGHVAKRYYAGGRTLSAEMLRDTYASIMKEAEGLKDKYVPDMQNKARTLDAGQVLALVRGA